MKKPFCQKQPDVNPYDVKYRSARTNTSAELQGSLNSDPDPLSVFYFIFFFDTGRGLIFNITKYFRRSISVTRFYCFFIPRSSAGIISDEQNDFSSERRYLTVVTRTSLRNRSRPRACLEVDNVGIIRRTI